MLRNITLCGLFYVAADACKPIRKDMPPLVNGLFLGSVVATGVWALSIHFFIIIQCSLIMTHVAYCSIIYPFDTLKSQMQTAVGAETSKTMTDRALIILREEGVRGFFRGIGPGLLRSAMGNGAGMMAFEAMRVLCHDFL